MSQPTSPDDSEQRLALHRQLDAIEKRTEGATTPTRARLYNQAGDLYARLGDPEKAVRAYGKAIDAYIETHQITVATGLCIKVVRRFSTVTRVHFTLACLALHQGLRLEAARSIQAYGAAARASSMQTMAIPRLRFLARGVSDPTVREAIAEQLASLGDEAGSRMIRESKPQSSTSALVDATRAKLLLEAATQGSDAVWASFWLK